ncbi:hypothetical protein CMQ_7668 [Grosmannia clavigera kw1407]|uniref:Ras modification protein ERF4 n=1 Tax=Grosmannia clavigera (strain kw1407 / UAMH 11150) TaxID=655863 RepID=F0XPZ2_GROCL|nr:uncharacterized protein CMQ_7668 [Grosmannia clavigera kw1407]EFX00666.1 hypothetical protein CMQ_7668 [Grosmannia clavigera kw1407]
MLGCRWTATTPLNYTGTSTGVSVFPARQPVQQRLPATKTARQTPCRACFVVLSRGGRFGGRPLVLVPTASHAPPANLTNSTAAIASSFSDPSSLPVNVPLPAPTTFPDPGSTPNPPPAAAAASRYAPPSSSRPFVPLNYGQPPFRSRAATTFQRPLRRLSAARLWNPTNSTPRSTASSARRNHSHLQPLLRPQPHAPAHRRAPSTPLPPAVALSHPVLHDTRPVADDDPIGTGVADYPLLTLPEQRQVRHSTSTRASLQVERAGSEKRVSLPKSLRHSYDGKRLAVNPESSLAETTDLDPDRGVEAAERIIASAAAPRFSGQFSFTFAGPSSTPDPGPQIAGLRRLGQSASKPQAAELSHHSETGRHPRPDSATAPASGGPFGLVFAPIKATKQDKGKGKMAPAESEDVAITRRSYSRDLERGPDVMSAIDGGSGANKEDHANRNSTVSMPDGIGIGSAISSSNSSIMGDPEAQPDAGEEWGPQHPCFPHRNPHVPMDSPEYVTTRIIRIRRDWLIAGDLAPTFSNLYPEILDPAGMPEHEFRRVVDKLNKELCGIFEPWTIHNIIDGVLGLLTGWLWEDMGMTTAKRRLAQLERWVERWNESMAAGMNGSRSGLAEDGPIPPKIIPLRETGYMTIGDPEIAPAPASTVASRAGQPMEEASAS